MHNSGSRSKISIHIKEVLYNNKKEKQNDTIIVHMHFYVF